MAISKAKRGDGHASHSRSTTTHARGRNATPGRVAPTTRAVAQGLKGCSSRFDDGRHVLNLALLFGLRPGEGVQFGHVFRNAGDAVHGTRRIAHRKGSIP